MHLLSYPSAWYPTAGLSIKGNCDSPTKCRVVQCPVINIQSLLSVLGFQGGGGCYSVSLIYSNDKIVPVGGGRVCTADRQLRMGLNDDADDRTHTEHDKGRSGNLQTKTIESMTNSEGSSFRQAHCQTSTSP